MEQLKYFVFNKERDYQSGYGSQITFTDGGISLKEGAREGTFFSCLLDSGQEKNQWHRAVIRREDYGDDSICFYFYCSEEAEVFVDGKKYDWEEIIRDETLSSKEKHRLMEPYLAHRMYNPADVLLYHAQGRYLWIEIQLFCQAGFLPKIRHMRIYAANRSFLQLLPMIFQNGGREQFLGRFLGLFEAVYEDFEEKIADCARQFSPLAADSEFLHWLARWVGISSAHLWQEEKLRLLLQGIVRKNLIRGTREYMEHMIETFTGERPFFLEYCQIEQYPKNGKAYQSLRQLYPYGPYEVSVLVREQAVPSLREQHALKKMIDECKPAHIQMHLILLRPGIYLGQNVYVGVNSVLAAYERAGLNGLAAIPSLVGQPKEEAAEPARAEAAGGPKEELTEPARAEAKEEER